MRFVHPCLTTGEHEMSSKHNRRLDYFQESLRTEVGGRGTISSCVSSGGGKKGNEGRPTQGNTYTGLQSEYSLRSLSLGHSVSQDGLSHGSGDVSSVWISSWQKQWTAYLPSLPCIFQNEKNQNHQQGAVRKGDIKGIDGVAGICDGHSQPGNSIKTSCHPSKYANPDHLRVVLGVDPCSLSRHQHQSYQREKPREGDTQPMPNKNITRGKEGVI